MVSLTSLSPIAQKLVWRSTPAKVKWSPRIAKIYFPLKIGHLPEGPLDTDLLGIIGKYLLPNQVNISELEKAIASSVLISHDKECQKPGSSGIVVNHKGKKYLAMAHHTLADKLRGKKPSMHARKIVGGKLEIISLDDNNLISLTRESYGDVALFNYSGNIEGVELSEQLDQTVDYQSFAIGFPSNFQNEYIRDLNPLLSFGFIVRDENVANDCGWQPDFSIPPKYDPYYKKTDLSPLLFSGITIGGNSGCGLFGLDGKLVGMCHGSLPVIPDTDKKTPRLFYSVSELFES